MSNSIIILSIIIITLLIYFLLKDIFFGSKRIKYSDYNKRIDKYTLKILVNPEDSLAYYERGKVHLKLGNKKQALEDLKFAGIYGHTKAFEIIEHNKLQQFNSNPIFNLTSNLTEDIDKVKFIEYKDTLNDLNKEIKKNPKNSLAYFMRANIKEICKDHISAMDDLTMAIKINNNYAEAYYKRGKIKLDVNEMQGAKIDLEKAVSLNFVKAKKLIDQINVMSQQSSVLLK